MLKKLCAVLIIAALLWAGGPLPAFAAQVAAPTAAKGSVFPITGASALGALPLGTSGPAAHLTAISGLGAQTLGRIPSVPSLSPHPLLSAPAAPQAAAAQDLSAQPKASEVLVPEASLTLTPMGGGASVSLPVTGRADDAPLAAEESGATASGALISLEEKLSRRRGAGGSEAQKVGVLDEAFDGSRPVKRADVVSLTGHRTGPTASSLSTTLSPSVQAAASVSEEPKTPAPEKPEGKIPVSYYLYLAGQFLYALGQEATSLIAPLYAYAAQGLAFAVATQAAFLIAILPGSFLGAKWVQRFDAKKVYLAGNLIHGLVALSVPVLHVLTGAFSPWHFLASNIVAGFIYGSLRGVAEKEIAPRIMGQEDRGRLNKAGALFYAAFEGAELVAALAIAAAIPFLGLNPTAAIMSAVMLASVIPIWFMKLKKAGSGSAEKEEGGTEKKLPKMLYMPYLFSLFSHLSLYMFLAPFLALEVFHQESLNSTIVAFYTVGSLVVALVTAYAPKLAGKLSEKGWAAAGVASMLAFLAASLVLQSPALTMAAAFLLGIGLTGMQVQWRSLYQQKLAIDVQPKVFKWLSVWGVLATLPPFAFIQAGLFMGWSMPVLLTAVAAAIAAVSLGVPLTAWLSKRLRKQSRA